MIEIVKENANVDMITSNLSDVSAFWYKSSGNNDKLYPVDLNHVNFVIANPDLFGLTKEEIEAVYASYGEGVGFEGKAREEIIKRVASNGWIRIRHYKRPQDYWSIQFNNWKYAKKRVEDFVMYALNHLNMREDDAVVLLGFEDDYKEVYLTPQGGVMRMFRESINKPLKEASLGRLHKLVTGGYDFGIVSAYRTFDDEANGLKFTNEFQQYKSEFPDKTNEEIILLINKKNTEELKEQLRNLNMGYIELSSGFENTDEESFMIPGLGYKTAVKLGVLFKQKSVIVKEDDFFGIVYTTDYTDEDGSHKVGDRGMKFKSKEEWKTYDDGKKYMIWTTDTNTLKYAYSMFKRGNKSAKFKWAFIPEDERIVELYKPRGKEHIGWKDGVIIH